MRDTSLVHLNFFWHVASQDMLHRPDIGVFVFQEILMFAHAPQNYTLQPYILVSACVVTQNVRSSKETNSTPLLQHNNNMLFKKEEAASSVASFLPSRSPRSVHCRMVFALVIVIVSEAR